jgi:hypothetical protein
VSFPNGDAAARPHAVLVSRLIGRYARALSLPVSTYAKNFRSLSRRLRGVQRGQKTNLPVLPWQRLLPAKPIAIAKPGKLPGGVSLAELAVLATAAASVQHGAEIIEIGTFDGRTTLNFALNAAAHLKIFTLDLPPDVATKFMHAPGERGYVDKPIPGRHFRNAPSEWQRSCARITQLLGDSATFDWSPHHGRAGLVFVDGSHAYDSVVADSNAALRLVANRGVIIWHDYGAWEGVTRALEELEATRHLGLRHVRGTSLVMWRADERGDMAGTSQRVSSSMAK